MLTMAIVSQMFVYLQTHQIAHIKYVQFFVYQLYFNKGVKVYFNFLKCCELFG